MKGLGGEAKGFDVGRIVVVVVVVVVVVMEVKSGMDAIRGFCALYVKAGMQREALRVSVARLVVVYCRC